MAHWRLDGSSFVDSKGVYSLTKVGDPAGVQGKIGSALQFHRAVGAADATAATQYGFGSGYDALNAAVLANFTWAGWVKRGTWAVGDIHYFFSIRGDPVVAGSTANILLAIGGMTTGLRVYSETLNRATSPGGQLFAGATIPADGAWHHVGVVRTGQTCEVFLDGVSVGSTTVALFNQNGQGSPGIVTIGAWRRTNYIGQFDGGLDDVRFYNEAIDADAIAALYAAGVNDVNVTGYAAQLKQLLPRGILWLLEEGSEISKTLLGISEELARVDARGDDLIEETDPRTATETIAEWEEMLGLPDEFITEISADIAIRRKAVAQKYASRGGQSEAFFIELALLCGYSVTVEKYDLTRLGDRLGSRTKGDQWAYSFLVSATVLGADSLSTADFEAVIRHAVHAHANVVFEYPTPP